MYKQRLEVGQFFILVYVESSFVFFLIIHILLCHIYFKTLVFVLLYTYIFLCHLFLICCEAPQTIMDVALYKINIIIIINTSKCCLVLFVCFSHSVVFLCRLSRHGKYHPYTDCMKR